MSFFLQLLQEHFEALIVLVLILCYLIAVYSTSVFEAFNRLDDFMQNFSLPTLLSFRLKLQQSYER
jgi:hypothetical protein